METVQLARRAMATRFEIVLQGEDAVGLRAAGEEALYEISRLEEQLSFYRPTSAISRINARAAQEPVRVEPRLFSLLQTAHRLHARTRGAFDLTVAPLMRCWGFVNGTGAWPDPHALAEARRQTGMHLVHLNEADRTVAFERAGVQLDLGAIGKGYALDEAAALLREAGVTRALLHGGTSTIYAIGQPFDRCNAAVDQWKVALPYPGDEDTVLAVAGLTDEALAVSAVWGKAFAHEGRTFGHVLDPRLGTPVDGAVMAAVVVPSATVADALSTALLVLGREGGEWLASYAEPIRALVACPDSAGTLAFVEHALFIQQAVQRASV